MLSDAKESEPIENTKLGVLFVLLQKFNAHEIHLNIKKRIAENHPKRG